MPLSREQFDALRAKGLSVEQIARFESGERGQTLAPTGQPPAPPAPKRPPSPAPIAGHPLAWMAQRGDDVSGLLAAPGGFLPGPMGRSASGVGGFGGDIIEQMAAGQMPPDFMQAGREGMKQTALTGFGQILGGTSRMAARPFMNIALRPKLKMGKMAPNVVGDALEQGATVSGNVVGGGSTGTGKVLGEAGAVTKRGIERVDAQGIPLPGGATARVRVQMSRMIPRVDDVVAKKSSKAGADRAEAHRVIDEMLASYPKPQNMADVKAIKQQLQDEARAIWETKMPGGKNLRFNEKGIPIGEEVPIEVRIKFAAAHNLQKFMEGIPEAATGIKGGFKASEAATKKAIGVHGAVREAEAVQRSGVPWWIPGTVGRGTVAGLGGAAGYASGDSPQEQRSNAALGLAAGATLAHPAVASRLAWLLYQQGASPALMRQVPRITEMMFNSGDMPDSLRTKP